jgi:hypothetical protein
MRCTLFARGLARVAHSSHSGRLLSFFGELLGLVCDDSVPSVLVAALLLCVPLLTLRCWPSV